MHHTLRTHEIAEVVPGVFTTFLVPCSAAVLRYVLAPEVPHVWIVEHAPDPHLVWSEQDVLLAPAGRPMSLRVRGLVYDLEMPTAEFVERVLPVVPVVPGTAGVLLLQLDRPVPDSLRYREVVSRPAWSAILRQNGWRLTFDLPHGGEYAAVTAPDRGTIERVLAEPVIAAGGVVGELP
jgi:hypothetical protein